MISLLRSKLKQLWLRSRFEERARFVHEGKTHSRRWADDNSYNKNWSRRAALAADMLQGYEIVCDIGCGMQDLRRELAPGVKYLPMDIVQRTPDTIVCEINKKILPMDYVGQADVTTVLGVIEYLNDPIWLLRTLADKSTHVLVSYCIAAPEDSSASRASRGWTNSYDIREFEALLASAGLKPLSRKNYDESQLLWLCQSTL